MKLRDIIAPTLVLFACFESLAANPQRHRPRNPNAKVTVVGNHGESPDSVRMAFEDNAPANRNIEGIPRFAIVGKEGNFYLGIGANMKLNGVYDWGDEAGSVNNFSPALFTKPGEGDNAGAAFSAQESNVYLNIVALPGKKDRFSLFLSVNFKDDKYMMKLSHFYARYRGLTIGYTDSPFVDGDAVPLTLDDEGPCGAVSSSSVVIYWTQDLGHGFSCQGGFDAPGHTLTYDDNTSELNNAYVSIPVAAQYRWSDGSHVRLSGLLRPLQYRDQISHRNRMLTGWGVQVSGLWGFLPKLCLYYDAVVGKGISDYINDVSGTGADATPSFVNKGRENASTCWGYSLGLSYDIVKKLSAHAVYSQVRVNPHSQSIIPESGYRYGQTFTANMIYNINQFVTVGLEYNWGKKATFEEGKLHVNRMQALFSLAF